MQNQNGKQPPAWMGRAKDARQNRIPYRRVRNTSFTPNQKGQPTDSKRRRRPEWMQTSNAQPNLFASFFSQQGQTDPTRTPRRR